MSDTRGDGFRKELEDFLTLVKDNGIAAIAFATEEGERMRLLNFMQTATRMEISLKQSLVQYESDMNLEVIADGESLDLNTMANSGPVLQTVKVEADD